MPEEILETQQTAEPMVEPKLRNWPKIILTAVLGFGLLFGAAYAGYWYGTESAQLKSQISKPQPKAQTHPTPTSEATPSPTQNPVVEGGTKDWKTYKSDEYRIEFKYPSMFTQKETVDMIYLESTPQKYTVSFAVDYFDNIIEEIRKLSEEEARQQSRSFLVSEVEHKLGVGQLIQGEKLIVRRFLDSGGSYDEEIIYFKGKNHSFAIQTSDKKFGDQILSTFKFLD